MVWTGGVLNFFIIYYLLFIILLHLFYLYFLPAFENCTNLTNQRFLFTIPTYIYQSFLLTHQIEHMREGIYHDSLSLLKVKQV